MSRTEQPRRTAPYGGRTGAGPGSSRDAGRQVLADLVTQLSRGVAVLAEDASSPAAELARRRLHEAREALSLLALERAAQAAGQPAGAEAGPALARRTELVADARAAQAGRAFLRQTLEVWRVPASVVNAAVDVGSELVANAARETRSHVVLSAALHTHALVISVWDDGSGRPQLRPYRAGISERGIGLRLVTHLSEEWGWYHDAHGKWVWAQLAVPERAGAEASP